MNPPGLRVLERKLDHRDQRKKKSLAQGVSGTPTK